MTNENPSPEELDCNCGSTLRRVIGSGFLCTECGASCTLTGRSNANIKPPPLADFSNRLARAQALGWPGPYEHTSEDLWAELDTFGPFNLPGNG